MPIFIIDKHASVNSYWSFPTSLALSWGFPFKGSFKQPKFLC